MSRCEHARHQRSSGRRGGQVCGGLSKRHQWGHTGKVEDGRTVSSQASPRGNEGGQSPVTAFEVSAEAVQDTTTLPQWQKPRRSWFVQGIVGQCFIRLLDIELEHIRTLVVHTCWPVHYCRICELSKTTSATG